MREFPSSRAARFFHSDRGAVAVEFSLVLPFLLLIFVLFIEGSKLMFSYQAAVSGVRDAGRYLARVVPGDICSTGGTVAGHAAKLKTIVESSIDGDAIMTGNVAITSVTPGVACFVGTYRNSPVPVATVTASLTLSFPARGILDMFGGGMGTVSTTVSDQARVIGQ